MHVYKVKLSLLAQHLILLKLVIHSFFSYTCQIMLVTVEQIKDQKI